VRTKLLKAASHLMEVPVEQLAVANGIVSALGTNRSMTIKEVANAVYAQMGRIPHDVREDLVASETYDPYLGTATSATHLAMVEIDSETYGVTVTRYVVAEDCGRVINPSIVEGQVQGAVAQGIGVALLEEVIHDGEGQIVSASLADYLVPIAGTMPNIGIVHVETVLPPTQGGVRGMGEGGTIGAPAAIANAISDALSPLGLEVTTLPMTPDRIFQLVDGARKGRDGSCPK
jgi:aerobic carbon-monoxide dehydrogenase large subunit